MKRLSAAAVLPVRGSAAAQPQGANAEVGKLQSNRKTVCVARYEAAAGFDLSAAEETVIPAGGKVGIVSQLRFDAALGYLVLSRVG